jgi:hypothetical protein
LAAAAMLRLVAAGIRSDVGETLVELMRYKCSADHTASTTVMGYSVIEPHRRCNRTQMVRMRVRMTHMIANDADMSISLIDNISR